MYKNRQKLKRYSDYDQARHQKLCAIYIRDLATDHIPPEWVLVDGRRPPCRHNLKRAANALSSALNTVSTEHTAITQSARGMLSTIGKLFASASKRTGGKLRPGNVEGMFFAELAVWIGSTLPRLNFKEQSSLNELLKMQKYCQAILAANVLIQENNGRDATRNNPASALEEVIDNLSEVIATTKELIKSATFSDHITRISNGSLGLAAQSIHVMNLLIQGEHEHESALPVGLFLSKDQTHRPKIHEFKEQRLAQWLERLLITAGVSLSGFRNSRTPTLAEADAFLEGECHDDAECLLPRHLMDATHKDWGHWPFLIENGKSKKENQEHAREMLRNTRQVYRDVLKIFHINSLLANARKIAPTYGEAWLYGDRIGSAIVEALLSVSEASIEKLNTSLSTLWGDASKTVKGNRNKLKADSTVSTSLAAAQEQFDAFTAYHAAATEGITGIRAVREDIDHNLREAEESKQQLLRGLVDFYRYYGLVSREEYRVLEEALAGTPAPGRLMAGAGAAAVTAPASLPLPPTDKRIPKSSMPCYQEALRLLTIDRTEPPKLRPLIGEVSKTLKVLAPSTKCNPVHRHIYNDFLVRNKRMVGGFDWMACPWISPSKMDAFRDLYFRVNTLFAFLYSPKATKLEGVELKLVNRRLEEAMSYYYTEFYADPCFNYLAVPREEPDFIPQNTGDETVTIRLAPYLLPHAECSLSAEYAELSEQHRVLLAKHSSAREEIIERDRSILELKAQQGICEALRAQGIAGAGARVGEAHRFFPVAPLPHAAVVAPDIGGVRAVAAPV